MEENNNTAIEDQAQDQTADNTPDNEQEQNEPDALQITLGDPQEDNADDHDNQPAPKWVKELRQNQRKLQQENRELKQKLASSLPVEPAIQIGDKPTLENCDYDADVFAEKLLEWNEKKRQVDQQAEQKRKAHEDAEKAWNDKLHGYNDAKRKLNLTDYDEAEFSVQESLDATQQGIIIHGSDNPAVLVYALGKNPGKTKELAAIKDPVKFSWAVSKLEAQLKVTNKKSVPSPEKIVSGSGGGFSGSAADKTLDRLRAEAAKTGDMTKVLEYKRKMKG